MEADTGPQAAHRPDRAAAAALGQGTVLLCQLERRCLLTPLLVPRAGHGAGWDGSPPLKPRTGHDEAVALTEGASEDQGAAKGLRRPGRGTLGLERPCLMPTSW